MEQTPQPRLVPGKKRGRTKETGKADLDGHCHGSRLAGVEARQKGSVKRPINFRLRLHLDFGRT